MIRISDNLEVNKPAPLDARLGVFSSTSEALNSIAEDRRFIGLTVIVDTGSGAQEYWFESGVENADLVAKSTGGGGFNCADLLTCTDFTDLQSDVSDLQSDIANLVPYTGATQNVDLGEYQIKAGQYEFDQTPTQSSGVAKLRWNDTDGTLDLGLKGGNVTLQIGQEQVIRVVNGTGANLLEANYQAVRITGAQGQRLQVLLAQANNDANSVDTIGLVTETINNNQEGFITTSGLIRNINTTGSLQGETWNDGDVLYLSGTTAGAITKVKPSAPTHTIIVGYVVYAHQNNGKIFVKVDNGYELDELHNVSAVSPTNRNGLFFNSSNNLWESRSVAIADLPTTLPIGYTAPLATILSGGVITETQLTTITIPPGAFKSGDNILLTIWGTRTSGGATGVNSTISLRITNTAGAQIMTNQTGNRHQNFTITGRALSDTSIIWWGNSPTTTANTTTVPSLLNNGFTISIGLIRTNTTDEFTLYNCIVRKYS